MKLDFKDRATTFVSGTKATMVAALKNLDKATIQDLIKTSKNTTGIELRMLPPFIKDNHTEPFLFFPGYANLYCLTIVVSDVTNQLAGNIDLKGFPRIGDNEHLPINKTVFYWQSSSEKDTAPNQVHIMCTIIKSKKALRDTGKILASLKKDENYKSLLASLAKIGKDATGFGLATDIITDLASLVGGALGNVEDKPIGTVINSYTALHGDFDRAGITQLVYNTKDVDFNFQLVVREQPIATPNVAAIAEIKAPGKKSKVEEQEEKMIVDMAPL